MRDSNSSSCGRLGLGREERSGRGDFFRKWNMTDLQKTRGGNLTIPDGQPWGEFPSRDRALAGQRHTPSPACDRALQFGILPSCEEKPSLRGSALKRRILEVH